MFKNIWYTLLSMFTVFKHLFKRPVTLEYPEKKKEVSENFRGKLAVDGCIKCGTCMKVCPSGAITISENEFKIDLKKKFYDVLWNMIAETGEAIFGRDMERMDTYFKEWQ